MRLAPAVFTVSGVVVGFTFTVFIFHTVKKTIHIREEKTFLKLTKTQSDSPQVKTKAAKLLCWILTQPKNFHNKTRAVKETWSKRCDITLFFSSEFNRDIPTIKINVSEGRRYLAKKSVAILRYIYKHYYETADWFFKADDDTYVIVENLRHFLSKRDTFAPFYYGRILNGLDEGGYNSGGAGYLLGKEALKRLAIYAPSTRICNRGLAEDMVVGRCLRALGVGVGRATDIYGRPIFNFIPPTAMIAGRNPDWAYGRTYVGMGADSVSPISASFHYVGPKAMRTMEFLLYNVTVHGLQKPKGSDLL